MKRKKQQGKDYEARVRAWFSGSEADPEHPPELESEALTTVVTTVPVDEAGWQALSWSERWRACRRLHARHLSRLKVLDQVMEQYHAWAYHQEAKARKERNDAK